eukprot:evm.model.scf_167.5 EVM.evm.TU.scf_167.5   scf_167:48359-49700(+)
MDALQAAYENVLKAAFEAGRARIDAKKRYALNHQEVEAARQQFHDACDDLLQDLIEAEQQLSAQQSMPGQGLNGLPGVHPQYSANVFSDAANRGQGVPVLAVTGAMVVRHEPLYK